MDQSENIPDIDADDDEDSCPFLLAACSEFADNPEVLKEEIEEHKRLKTFFKPMMKYPSPFD